MKATKTNTLFTVAAIVSVLVLLYFYREPKALPAPVVTKEDVSEPLRNVTSQVSSGVNGYLRGLREVQLVISMNDNAKSVVEENAIRMEMEFNLRRSGLNVVERRAPYVLVYGLSTQSRDSLSVYNADCHLVERVVFLREEEKPTSGLYQVWNAGNFGTVGTDNAKDALVKQSGEAARQFAQAWTDANPVL
jgi:hypothetical protein